VYLLDTNVISEVRKPRPHGGVLQWISEREDQHLHIAAMTVAEIQAGVEITRAQDPVKALEIEQCLDKVVESMSVIPHDAAVMRVWARMMHRSQKHSWEDAMIAAVARVHGLTVATRNTEDFKPFGVPMVNPFVATAPTR
jgi:predicted nucleic acid-binding protein